MQDRNSLRCAERSSVCECRDCVNPNSEESIDIAEEFRRTELRDDCKVDYKRPGRSLTDETMAPGRAPRWRTRANIQVDFLRSNV